MPRPTRPSPPPLRVDTARVVLVGIALWVVALVVVLLLGDRLDRVWTWTCLCAIALAVGGLGIMRWQEKDPRAPQPTLRADRDPARGP